MSFRFRSPWDPPAEYRLPSDYDFDPVSGFQPGQAEPIATLIARYQAGDITVGRPLVADDEYPMDSYPDSFDVMDRMLDLSERSDGSAQEPGNSVSSDSQAAEQPLGDAQAAADNPGETEIAPKDS